MLLDRRLQGRRGSSHAAGVLETQAKPALEQLQLEMAAAASHPPPHLLPAALALLLALASTGSMAAYLPYWPYHTPCRKENNGNDPTVNLINKAGGWGASSGGGGDAQGGSNQPERAISAQPSAAWGGAGLPEERKKQVGAGCLTWVLLHLGACCQRAASLMPMLNRRCPVARRKPHSSQDNPPLLTSLLNALPALPCPASAPALPCRQVEMASQQEFPTLGNEGAPRGHHHNPAVYHEDHRRPWDADERSYAGGWVGGWVLGRVQQRRVCWALQRGWGARVLAAQTAVLGSGNTSPCSQAAHSLAAHTLCAGARLLKRGCPLCWRCRPAR